MITAGHSNAPASKRWRVTLLPMRSIVFLFGPRIPPGNALIPCAALAGQRSAAASLLGGALLRER